MELSQKEDHLLLTWRLSLENRLLLLLENRLLGLDQTQAGESAEVNLSLRLLRQELLLLLLLEKRLLLGLELKLDVRHFSV